MAKSLDQMTSTELYQLAEKRKLQERDMEKEAQRERVEALRNQRKELVARHKKELAALDAEIKALAGGRAARAPRARGKVNVSQKVLEIIAGAGTASTSDIKKALADLGIVGGNLSQTLAYLKRQGKVTSVGRAQYKAS
jgi:2-polyprenyl-3-methyl-5-hydroxy-6-metoxy-1,4-benzoquinol methylase